MTPEEIADMVTYRLAEGEATTDRIRTSFSDIERRLYAFERDMEKVLDALGNLRDILEDQGNTKCTEALDDFFSRVHVHRYDSIPF